MLGFVYTILFYTGIDFVFGVYDTPTYVRIGAVIMREFDCKSNWVLGLIDFFKFEVLSPLANGVGDELITVFNNSFVHDMEHLSVVEDWYVNVLNDSDAEFVSAYFAEYKLRGKDDIYRYHRAIGLLYYFLRVIPFTTLVHINDTLLLGKTVADKMQAERQEKRNSVTERFKGKRIFDILSYPVESEYLDFSNSVRAVLLLNGIDTVADILYYDREGLKACVGSKTAESVWSVLEQDYCKEGLWV